MVGPETVDWHGDDMLSTGKWQRPNNRRFPIINPELWAGLSQTDKDDDSLARKGGHVLKLAGTIQKTDIRESPSETS